MSDNRSIMKHSRITVQVGSQHLLGIHTVWTKILTRGVKHIYSHKQRHSEGGEGRAGEQALKVCKNDLCSRQDISEMIHIGLHMSSTFTSTTFGSRQDPKHLFTGRREPAICCVLNSQPAASTRRPCHIQKNRESDTWIQSSRFYIHTWLSWYPESQTIHLYFISKGDKMTKKDWRKRKWNYKEKSRLCNCMSNDPVKTDELMADGRKNLMHTFTNTEDDLSALSPTSIQTRVTEHWLKHNTRVYRVGGIISDVPSLSLKAKVTVDHQMWYKMTKCLINVPLRGNWELSTNQQHIRWRTSLQDTCIYLQRGPHHLKYLSVSKLLNASTDKTK